ncbi:hypothetical protein FGE12_27590 [Aggregicoccus sp. 17bor-14]|uniref:hypothetical protein n=1 Tax=Myxococcaceae TaxID=31 RepID=UPI00129C7757|nr:MULTISPECIES: hypothetical protein [Myxococcaceae]MBF5046211.1 hypothetical protein [Simulacricoccus sp. 17bor-14]MRI91935.1 hypothetical protein [Aggregicoccus sp. 17bor-14]
MQKKVLIGVGVGCGVVLLLIVGVVVAGGLYVKHKVEDTTAGLSRVNEQQASLAALDKRFPFKDPGEDELLKLDEKRLEAYFAIREEALPVFKSYEEKSKAFEKKHGKADSEHVDLGASMEAMKILGGLVADMRASYISSLEKHAMSPREFHAITRTLYSTYVAGAMQGLQAATAAQRGTLEKELEALDTKLEDEKLDDETRTGLQAQRDAIQQQLDAADQMVAEQAPPSEKSREALAANTSLLEKNKERIQNAANPAFDVFLFSNDEDPGQ